MRFCSARSAPGVLRVIMDLMACSFSSLLHLPCLIAVEIMPVPSGLVRISMSLGLAWALAV